MLARVFVNYCHDDTMKSQNTTKWSSAASAVYHVLIVSVLR